MLCLIIGHTDQPGDDAHALLQIDCGKNKRDKVLETPVRDLTLVRATSTPRPDASRHSSLSLPL